MTACIEQGITVTSIPGAAAVISALVTSGLATGQFFAFEGFLSVNKKQRRTHLEEIKDERRTMIFMKRRTSCARRCRICTTRLATGAFRLRAS